MNALVETKRKRFRLLYHLYEKTGANVKSGTEMWQLGTDLGFTGDETRMIADYLEGEGLATIKTLATMVAGKFHGGTVLTITHKGVKEIEAALSEPDRPTHYFPPSANILIVHGGMHNSPVQQGAQSSTQTISYASEKTKDLRQFLVLVKNELLQSQLAPDDRSQAEAEIGTMQSQLTAPKPNWGILKASGQALHGILLGVAGNLATDLMKHLAGVGS